MKTWGDVLKNINAKRHMILSTQFFPIAILFITSGTMWKELHCISSLCFFLQINTLLKPLRRDLVQTVNYKLFEWYFEEMNALNYNKICCAKWHIAEHHYLSTFYKLLLLLLFTMPLLVNYDSWTSGLPLLRGYQPYQQFKGGFN